MPKLTIDEEIAFDELDETHPEAAEIFRECWPLLSEKQREQFARFAERLAAIPHELKPTDEQLQCMLDTDTDFPLN